MTCAACGGRVAPGAGFCSSCGRAVAPAPNISFCPGCGSALVAGAAHCGQCGRVVSTAATPLVPPGPDPAERNSNRLAWVLGGTATVLAIAVVVVLVVVLSVGSGESDDGLATSRSSSTTTAAPTTTTAPAPTTTLDPVSQARQDHPKLYEVALRLENIITQSTQGRTGVGEAVGGVRECTMDPYEAERAIDAVIDNRSTVLNQVASVDVTGEPEAAALVDKLQEALQHSIDADFHYNAWISYLYSDYYYTTPIGCPSGQAPRNVDYEEATADSGRATTAKQDFVARYNPIAISFGLRTWEYTDI